MSLGSTHSWSTCDDNHVVDKYVSANVDSLYPPNRGAPWLLDTTVAADPNIVVVTVTSWDEHEQVCDMSLMYGVHEHEAWLHPVTKVPR